MMVTAIAGEVVLQIGSKPNSVARAVVILTQSNSVSGADSCFLRLVFQGLED
jgi:hypothetical protein